MAQVLQEAVKDLDFELYIGLLNVRRSGPAEGGYRGDWSLMEEDCEESFELHSLVNMSGERVKVDINISKLGKLLIAMRIMVLRVNC